MVYLRPFLMFVHKSAKINLDGHHKDHSFLSHIIWWHIHRNYWNLPDVKYPYRLHHATVLKMNGDHVSTLSMWRSWCLRCWPIWFWAMCLRCWLEDLYVIDVMIDGNQKVHVIRAKPDLRVKDVNTAPKRVLG